MMATDSDLKSTLQEATDTDGGKPDDGSVMHEEKKRKHDELNANQDDDDDDDDDDEEDDDDDDMEEDESHEEQAREVKRLEELLKSEPTNYNAYVQLIGAARKIGLLDKLRSSREALAALYPLAPQMWLEWTADETRLIAGPSDVEDVEKLFERAVADYLNIPLWLAYVAFLQEHDADVASLSATGIATLRGVLERSLTQAGLHFSEGFKLWEKFREVEEGLLQKMEAEDADAKALGKQVDRIRSLFHRQLSIPHSSLDSTVARYISWENSVGQKYGSSPLLVSPEGSQASRTVAAAAEVGAAAGDIDSNGKQSAPEYAACLPLPLRGKIERTKAAGAARETLEARVREDEERASASAEGAAAAAADASLHQAFLEYTALEEGSGDPARAQILYERAVATLPLLLDLWLRYAAFLDTKLKIPSVATAVLQRAVRNCPWSGTLWSKLMLSLERMHAEDDKTAEAFERALVSGMQTAEEFLDVFLLRADSLVRRLREDKVGDGAGKDGFLSKIGTVLQRAFEFFSSYFTDRHDCLLLVARYQSHVATKLAGNIAAARNVWEAAVRQRGGEVQCWLEYIKMEEDAGNPREARALFRRCYSRRFDSADGTQIICDAWQFFERFWGDLNDYDKAMEKISTRLLEVQTFQQQQQQQQQQNVHQDERRAGRGEGRGKGGKEEKKPAAKRTRSEEEAKKSEGAAGDRGKRASAEGEGEGGGKKRQRVESEGTERAAGEEETMGGGKEGMHGRELSGQKGARAEATRDEEGSERGKELGMAAGGQRGENGRPGGRFTDERTAFVSGLPLKITEDEVRELFSPCGDLKAIRMAFDRQTKRFRGFAYIEFGDDNSLESALQLNKHRLQDRIISVKKSDPSARHRPEEKGGNQEGRRGFQASRGGGRGGRGFKGSSEDRQGSRVGHRRGGQLQLVGNATFAVPRNVARGKDNLPNEKKEGQGNSNNEENIEGTPQVASNAAFRELFKSKLESK